MRQFNWSSFCAGFCLFAAFVMFMEHCVGMGFLDLGFVAMNLAMALRKV